MAWGWGEILDAAVKLLAPAASSAASTAVQYAMTPEQKVSSSGAMGMFPSLPGASGPSPSAGPASPSAARAAGASAAGAGATGGAPTTMNFQGGFTGQAPADPAQGPKPISSGFSTIDPKKKQEEMGSGFESV